MTYWKEKNSIQLLSGVSIWFQKKSFDTWLKGYSYEDEENVSVGENRTEHKEPALLQKQQGMTKPANLDANKATDVTNQEASKYLEKQERFLRNWMKVYMMVDMAGDME